MKDKIISCVFLLIIFVFFILNIVVKDKEISYSERRYLNKLPEINIQNVFNGKISDEFENYITDNFILRDIFRKIKTNIQLNILHKLDYNDLYIKDDFIFKIEYPLNENKVLDFTYKINKIYETYLKNMNVYYSIIPDKNYYSNDNYLKLVYDILIEIVNKNIKEMKYIDITDTLNLNNYYYTDIHWKQETLYNTIKKLSESMNFKITNNYEEKTYYPFYGSYYGQLGLSSKKDVIKYLINDTIINADVKDIESNLTTIYEESSLGKIDSYDVFLGGATPIIEINNNKSENNKELIIFRDSFGSSIAPLLLEGYKKITLIDLRYISSSILEEYINFENQDVLFLYNTTIINQSDLIKA